MKDSVLEEALNKMRNWCSRQERSRKEVTTKLMRAGYDEEFAQKVIASLEEDNYLNEMRFAESYISGHFRMKKWGRLKIRQGLQLKGIVGSMGAAAMEEHIQEKDYFETLRNVLNKKVPASQWHTMSYPQKQKLMQYAYSRGFEPEIIRRVLEGSDYLA